MFTGTFLYDTGVCHSQRALQGVPLGRANGHRRCLVVKKPPHAVDAGPPWDARATARKQRPCGDATGAPLTSLPLRYPCVKPCDRNGVRIHSRRHGRLPRVSRRRPAPSPSSTAAPRVPPHNRVPLCPGKGTSGRHTRHDAAAGSGYCAHLPSACSARTTGPPGLHTRRAA